MPKNPSLEHRMQWHFAHARHYACRAIPPKLLAQIENTPSARAPIGDPLALAAGRTKLTPD